MHQESLIARASRRGSLAICIIALGLLPANHALEGQEDARTIRPGDSGIDVPDFVGFEVEYGSAFGRFFNEVRPYDRDGASKISVLNIIDMPGGVIVDSRGIDRTTLALEYLMSPYFAWGQEYIVAQMGDGGFDWQRIPLGGGEARRLTGSAEYGGFMDDLGFSPTLAALLPLPVGTRFRIPAMQPKADGTVTSVLLDYEIAGRETLELESGVRCECWVIDHTDAAGGLNRFWVSREAPFVFRRHRDIGGSRDFVSDVLSFRSY